ncbi:sigma factor-like helix-turn-helix DNA-binding protein [Streptomyces sp. NPDC015139]|uniref:sigma factor-like helix-turn-helix DNA-binding protein n=1 Tax=Streptomyces sp. NPDC015139 TaxID=3364942 RepID=UPI0036FE9D6B
MRRPAAPRQRAMSIFRDVLGRPVEEAATLMDLSVAASDSALQRARRTPRERLPRRRTHWAAGRHGQQGRDVVRRCVDAAQPHWRREGAQRCFTRPSDDGSQGLSFGSGRPGSQCLVGRPERR